LSDVLVGDIKISSATNRFTAYEQVQTSSQRINRFKQVHRWMLVIL